MTIIVVLVVVPCIGVVGLGVFGWGFFKNTLGPMAGCFIGFQHARDAVVQYANEHDGKLPNAKTWQDDVRETYRLIVQKNRDELGPIEPMSPDGPWGCKQESGQMTGMAFNSDLSGKKLSEIKDQHLTILLFEIETASLNANRPYKKMDDKTSPKIFGEHRGWAEIGIQGSLDMDDGGSFKVRTRDRDAETAPTAPETPTPPTGK